MSYCRMLCIVDHSYQDQFIAAINDFKSQRVHQASKHDLFYLEGRYYPEISVKKTYLLGIDGRNSGYVRHGNASLGKFFNAQIDLCVGFALDSSGYSQVRATIPPPGIPRPGGKSTPTASGWPPAGSI